MPNKIYQQFSNNKKYTLAVQSFAAADKSNFHVVMQRPIKSSQIYALYYSISYISPICIIFACSLSHLCRKQNIMQDFAQQKTHIIPRDAFGFNLHISWCSVRNRRFSRERCELPLTRSNGLLEISTVQDSGVCKYLLQ